MLLSVKAKTLAPFQCLWQLQVEAQLRMPLANTWARWPGECCDLGPGRGPQPF